MNVTKMGGKLATSVHIVLSLRNSFCNSVVIDTCFIMHATPRCKAQTATVN